MPKQRRNDKRFHQKVDNCAATSREPQPMTVASGRGGLSAAGGTDIGQAREANEDAYLIAVARGLFLVADGMGGHAAGEEASALAIRTLADYLTEARLATGPIPDTLTQGMRLAHLAITEAGQAQPAWEGMGTTVVLAALVGRTAYLANVGDSRAYLIRQGTIRQLSRDHSMTTFLVEQGLLTAEDAREHPARNQLLAALGVAHPEVVAQVELPLLTGDRLLLCTDGLWGMVTDAEMLATVQAAADPDMAVQALLVRANAAGGEDNITAVAIFVTDADQLKDAARAWDTLATPRANATIDEVSTPRVFATLPGRDV
jgi:serine/threonine protein phosphatase PrpC